MPPWERFSEANSLLAVLGVKLSVTEQVPPGATAVLQVLEVMVKSAALAPESETEL